MRMTYPEILSHSKHQAEHTESRLGDTEHRDIISTLKGYLHEEIEDVLKYTEMCTQTRESGHHRIAEGLSEIAMEEFTHAYFFKTQLECMGEDIEQTDSELRNEWRHVLRKLNLH